MMNFQWKPYTHQFIVNMALQKTHPRFQQTLAPVFPFLQLGIDAPDKLYGDTVNHCKHCTANQYGHTYGKLPQNLADEMAFLFQQLDFAPEILVAERAQSLAGIFPDALAATAFQLGVIAHYASDATQPLHTDGKERFPYETVPHKIFEADVRKHIHELTFPEFEVAAIADMETTAQTIIEQVNAYYDPIIDAYFATPDRVKPDRWEQVSDIAALCLAQAAQFVASIMVSVEKRFIDMRALAQRKALFQRADNLLLPKREYTLKRYKNGNLKFKVKS